MESVLAWLFSSNAWLIFRAVSNIGAPIIAIIGLGWYVYDRYTGGI